jgi:hypothetical protein
MDFDDFLILNIYFSMIFDVMLIDRRVWVLAAVWLIVVRSFDLGKYSSKLTDTLAGNFYL